MRILDTISRLYEVRAKRAQVLEKYSGSRIIKPVIYKRPSAKTNYYWVKVVEDHGGVLTTHFNFYVNEKNLEIRFLDPLKDKEMTLREWRKGRGW